MRDGRREKAERAGRLAETAAMIFLGLKGYRLLARRYKCPMGEVDLIMRKAGTTAFIEVKIRNSIDEAIVSVTAYQARRISAAARSYMGRDQIAARQACRFDIVAISPYHWPRHIENAFYGDG
jgi:putative endonuclease